MKIIKFQKKYTDEMASLYKNSYSESDVKHQWSIEKARESLAVCFKYFSDFCFIALDDKENCMGGIFCLVNPYYKGNILFIVSVQVKHEFRKKGVGKALLKRAIKKAKTSGLSGVRFLTDEGRDFPQKWYEKIGFKRSGYVEYAADIDGIKL